MLRYGLQEQAGFIVLTGEVGTGKTTLLRQLLNTIDDDVLIGLVTNTHASFGELMKWIMLAFDLPQSNMGEVDQHRLFLDFLLVQYAQGKRVVLIVDEAQNLGLDAVEQLRMLSNVNSEGDHLLQLVLVGQPELQTLLRRPELRQFVQRIAMDYHLRPLSSHEVDGYISHRLETAGGSSDIFSRDARYAVHFFTQGIPRLVNILCDLALVHAFADDIEKIGIDNIIDVVDERSRMGTLMAFEAVPLDVPRAELHQRILAAAETPFVVQRKAS
jgi:type II secretory pathway predicted ATPase ExeA